MDSGARHVILGVVRGPELVFHKSVSDSLFPASFSLTDVPRILFSKGCSQPLYLS